MNAMKASMAKVSRLVPPRAALLLGECHKRVTERLGPILNGVCSGKRLGFRKFNFVELLAQAGAAVAVRNGQDGEHFIPGGGDLRLRILGEPRLFFSPLFLGRQESFAEFRFQ